MAKTGGGSRPKPKPKAPVRRLQKKRPIMGGTIAGPAGAGASLSRVGAVVGPIGRALVRTYGYQVGMMGYAGQTPVLKGALRKQGLLPPGPKRRKRMTK